MWLCPFRCLASLQDKNDIPLQNELPFIKFHLILLHNKKTFLVMADNILNNHSKKILKVPPGIQGLNLSATLSQFTTFQKAVR